MTRYTPLWEQAGSYAASVDRRLIANIWPAGACNGCALTAVASTMQINVAAGAVAVPSQNSTGSTLCVSDAVEIVTIAAAPGSGQNRIDLIICRPRANDLDGGQNNDFIFDTVTGVPAASPTVPATPPGTVLLGQVSVAGGSAAITQANIADLRPPRLTALAEPALGAAAALASFTTLDGEVWVAKGGVNNGAWKKARDVLSARRYRTAAFSATGSQAILAMDTVDFDAYGLYVPAQNGFVIPIPGVWLIGFQFAATFTASQYARAVVNRNGAIAFQNQLWMNANTSTLPTSGVLALAANDLMQANIQAGATATGDNAAAVTKAENYFTAVYLGTG